jgi:alkylation response protein AidB-like acyl-CoA dehydrogenase
MNFELSEDQTMLQDALRRYLARAYGFRQRAANLDAAHGCSAEVWHELADQGLLGLGLPEHHGGSYGPFEIMVVMEQLGRALVLEPFFSTVVLCAGLVATHGTPAQQAEIVPPVIAGECRLALAHVEDGARYRLDCVNSVARESGGAYVLSGAKAVALDAPLAHLLIISAQIAASGQLGLFLVEPTAPGVKLIPYRTQDGRSAADVQLNEVIVPRDRLLGSAAGGLAALEHAVDRGIAALCAEAVGIIEALNETTLDYLKSRQQFGQPIGRFQVLQHRMADMFIMAVQARSMSVLASGHAGSSDRAARRHAISAAKAFIGKAARFVGQQAVQLHGGMGISAELIVSHYFKRLTIINATFGDADHHLGLISDALLAEAT